MNREFIGPAIIVAVLLIAAFVFWRRDLAARRKHWRELADNVERQRHSKAH